MKRSTGRQMSKPPEDGPRKTPFLPILLYTLGFMGAMALLAAVAAWLLRLLSR